MANTTAPSVNVSTISSAAKVVTVTTTAPHNLVANQGFSLQNISPVNSNLNINSTVLTVVSATSFTFMLSNPGTYTSGGILLPAKEVIILSVNVPVAEQAAFNYLVWLTTANPLPVANLTSQWAGASAQENAALAAGTTLEVARSFTFPAVSTKAEIYNAISADFADKQAALVGSVQPGQYFGNYFDGTGWSS